MGTVGDEWLCSYGSSWRSMSATDKAIHKACLIHHHTEMNKDNTAQSTLIKDTFLDKGLKLRCVPECIINFQ